MPQEFRYPLTRYCLRGGALTLPRAMVGLFPDSGEVTAVDTRSEAEHTLTVVDPRTVTGLGPIFKQHRLAVNDELLIRPLEDGRFSITAVKRDHKPDYTSSEAIEQVLDELIAASVPVTETEVRALYPGIPASLSLAEVFTADERFVRREGRWHNALSVAYPLEPAPSASRSNDSAPPVGSSGHDRTAASEDDKLAYAAVGAVSAGSSDAAAQAPRAPLERTPAQPAAGSESDVKPRAAGQDAGTIANLHAAPAPSGGSGLEVQAGLWQQAAPDEGSSRSDHLAPAVNRGRSAGTVLERRRPSDEGGHAPRERGAHGADGSRATAGDAADSAATNSSATNSGAANSGAAGSGAAGSGADIDVEVEVEADGGASLEVTELANRLRAVLVGIGFRIEPVARGQLLLTADMGRKSYTVLAQLLTRNDRLDWADLLARRRATNVRYLTVVGDYRALLRLTNPAELARATLWSWQALDRMAVLNRTVSFSPIELESHFERDGLFEKGLERFEAAVAKRVAERGAISELLTRLAEMRAPSVFMLEDIAGELKVPRDRLLRQLELLSEAPFHLVAKVDAGEFVLRQRVADSLSSLASYATSLRERLPIKQVEKLTGLAEPDLLTEEDLDVQVTDGLNSGSAT